MNPADLRGAVERANEPAPQPLPEQDTRVGEAMAGQHDSRMSALWRERVGKAQREVVALVPDFLDALATAEARIQSPFGAIAHGDTEHKAWLQEAISAHFAGKAIPEPRGKGTAEARIARLEGELGDFRARYIKADMRAQAAEARLAEREGEEAVERVAEAVFRELGTVEMVLADPTTIKRIQSKRIARAAIRALHGSESGEKEADEIRSAGSGIHTAPGMG